MKWRALSLAVAAALCAELLVAQARRDADVTQSEPGTRTVQDRVRRPLATGGDSTGMGPAASVWVTLHRVGQDSAGPVDSVRSDAAGRYRLRWRPFGATDAVYFAAVQWGGIAYFTAPLKSVDATADEAEITVFDTTSATFPLTVKGRHAVVGAVDTNQTRTIIEVFELSNDSLRTLVSAKGASAMPTWSIAIPLDAQDVRLTQGGIAPDAFSYANGRVSVSAPIAPGLKQIAFTYHLPAASFPVNLHAAEGAVVFEVLLEEEQGTVRGPGFVAVDPVTIENRRFRRFLAQDVKNGGTVTLELPATRAPGRALYIAAVLVAVGFVALLVLLRGVQRRAAATSGGVVSPATLRANALAKLPTLPLHERLAREVAALDATYARVPSPSESVTHAYHARRAELKAALADAMTDVLAPADPPT